MPITGPGVGNENAYAKPSPKAWEIGSVAKVWTMVAGFLEGDSAWAAANRGSIQGACKALSINSIQCLTGVAVPDCKWVMQPMLADTISSDCVACKFLILSSRN